MADTLRIALAQINPTVGDIDGNLKLIATCRRASAEADLVVLSELVISGYYPEDLVLKDHFLERCWEAAEQLAASTADGGPALLVGLPIRFGGHRHNAALLLDGGVIAATVLKRDLPNYGVFDEKRVFESGPLPRPIPFRGRRLGVLICEDMWTPDAAKGLAEAGAEILIVPNGSPYEADKAEERRTLAAARVAETGLPLVYVNQFGGQDEVVYDGASFVLDRTGALAVQLPAWRKALVTADFTGSPDGLNAVPSMIADLPEPMEMMYRAMVLGLQDYVGKNGFPGVILGLSGGIDSALSAAVAVDALGSANVRAVMMPSPYTSRESLEDAAECARLLGIKLDSISIEPAMRAFQSMLDPLFTGLPPDITEENIQSRARGVTLMAISNKLGHMVLSTGNKSEMSVGYATLYGDMCGGYAVLKDVYKTAVFELCRWRNASKLRDLPGRVMPDRVIAKPPSAELRPDQKDEDSLPPYAILDQILEGLVERQESEADLAARGFDPETVARVRTMLNRAEYKRRQAPPGVKLTRRSFGRERRYPITNGSAG